MPGGATRREAHEERLRRKALQDAEAGKIDLGPEPDGGLAVRWAYPQGVSLALWTGWVVGLVIPLTVLLPIGLATASTGLIDAALVVALLAGVPLANGFCVSQCTLAARDYDARQSERFSPVRLLLHGLLDDSTGPAVRERTRKALEGVLTRSALERNRAILSTLYVIPLRCNSARGRYVCWRGELRALLFLTTLAVLPALVLFPLALSPPTLDLSYTFGQDEARVVFMTLGLLSPAVFLIVKGAHTLWRLARRVNLSPSRAVDFSRRTVHDYRAGALLSRGGEHSRASPGRDRNPYEADTFFARNNVNSCARGFARWVPGWARLLMFQVWLFVLLPLGLGLSAARFYRINEAATISVSSESVKCACLRSATAIVSLFAVLLLLVWSVSRRTVLQSTKAEVAAFVTEELGYLSVCFVNGWDLGRLGDYPHFSIGEGIVTTGLSYHSKHAATILLRRMFLTMTVVALLPVVLLLVLFERVGPGGVGLLVGMVVCGPVLCVLFYAGKLLVGVLPRRRLFALPWAGVWVAAGLVLPLAAGALLRAFHSGSPAVGPAYLGYSILVFLCTLVGWLYSEREGFSAWRKRLTIQIQWLTEVSAKLWKISLVGAALADLGLLIACSVGSQLWAMAEDIAYFRFGALLIALSLMCNTFLITFLLMATTAGVLRSTNGLASGPPFFSLTAHWFIFSAGWFELYGAGQFVAGVSSLQEQSESLRIFTVSVVLLSVLAMAAYLIGAYKDWKLKEAFGYFPAPWEVAEGSVRSVREQASQVVAYPTEWIEADLRRRKLIEPSARELLAMYLDTSRAPAERMSLKNRFVLACSAPSYSREDLEAMLEEAIASDLEKIEVLERVARDRRKRQVMMSHEKSDVVRLKFGAFKAREVIEQIDREIGAVQSQHPPSRESASSGLRGMLLGIESKLTATIGAGATASDVHSYEDSSEDGSEGEDSSENGEGREGREGREGAENENENESADWQRRKAGTAESMLASDFVSLPEHYRDNPNVSAFEVARVDSVVQHIYVPQSRLYMFGKEKPFRRINYLVIIEGVTGRLLLVGFRVWKVEEVPFSWIDAVSWDDSGATEKSIVGATLVVTRPSRTCCGPPGSHQPGTGHARHYNLYFKSAAEREAFCMTFFRMTCVARPQAGNGDRSAPRPVFTYNGKNKVSQTWPEPEHEVKVAPQRTRRRRLK